MYNPSEADIKPASMRFTVASATSPVAQTVLRM